MKRTLVLGCLLGLSFAAQAIAQQPTLRITNDPPATVSIGEVAPTAEMWMYEQERLRHENPKLAVRAKAEARSSERRARIAAMKFYGLSNSRPVANPTPFTSSYSPAWVHSGPAQYHWKAPSGGIILQADKSSRNRY